MKFLSGGLWAMMVLLCSSVQAWAAGPVCSAVSFTGEVKAGESYTQMLGNGMLFDLEAVRSGWIVRVLPAGGARPVHDGAELATPPYNSVTPLAVTTDFSFRAQDAVAWNPRRFRFAADKSALAALSNAYAAYTANPQDTAAGEKLAELAAASPEAQLEILDSRFVPGTANQWQMAAAVALHLEQTPHAIDQGPPSPLGALTWLKFRVTLHLPKGFVAAKGLTTAPQGCK